MDCIPRLRTFSDDGVAVVFLIYVDSYMFVIATAVLQQSVGVNASIVTCEGAILLCLVCYVTTKVSVSDLPLYFYSG